MTQRLVDYIIASISSLVVCAFFGFYIATLIILSMIFAEVYRLSTLYKEIEAKHPLEHALYKQESCPKCNKKRTRMLPQEDKSLWEDSKCERGVHIPSPGDRTD